MIPEYFIGPDGQIHSIQPAVFSPQQVSAAAQNPWTALLGAGLVLAAFWALGTLLAPQPTPRRSRRAYTGDPVSIADKEYVSVRDGWRCTYCGKRVTRRTRHIDHSVSRVNGGTNHLNNLRLSCAPCNLSKGPLNSREFVSC